MKIVLATLILIVVIVLAFFLIRQRNPDLELTLEQSRETTPLSDSGSDVSDSNADVIAGTVTPYKKFEKAEYDKAVADGKAVFLNFYANWCPICRAEASEIAEGFNKLSNSNLVGFRVNFKDDETDDDEKALASEFEITYQHSKVIIKEGKTVYKQIADQWNREKVVKELGGI